MHTNIKITIQVVEGRTLLNTLILMENKADSTAGADELWLAVEAISGAS